MLTSVSDVLPKIILQPLETASPLTVLCTSDVVVPASWDDLCVDDGACQAVINGSTAVTAVNCSTHQRDV